MSVHIMATVFEAELPDLVYIKDGRERKAKASTVKLMLLAYADHANDDGEASYPGYTLLERKTGLSRQGIADTLEAITQNGLMSLVGTSKRHTNNYEMNLEKLQQLVKPLDYQKEERVKPLDSSESSHLTSTSQATGLNPSFNHPLTIQREREDDPIATALLGLRIVPNALTAQMIADWKLHHTDDWILRAIHVAKDKGARSANYVDSILVGWEANGYPKPRKERVQDAKKQSVSEQGDEVIARMLANGSLTYAARQ